MIKQEMFAKYVLESPKGLKVLLNLDYPIKIWKKKKLITLLPGFVFVCFCNPVLNVYGALKHWYWIIQ